MTRKSVPTTALPRTATATSSYRTRLVPGAPQPTSYRYPIPFRKFSSNHNEIPQLQQRPDQEMAHGSFIHDDHLDFLSCPHPRPRTHSRTHSSHSSSLPARRPHPATPTPSPPQASPHPMPPKAPLQFLVSISVRSRLTNRASRNTTSKSSGAQITEAEPLLDKNLKKQKSQASTRSRRKMRTGEEGKGNAGPGGTVEVVEKEKEKMQASKETVVTKTRKS